MSGAAELESAAAANESPIAARHPANLAAGYRLTADLLLAREAAMARISPEENQFVDWLYERREFRKQLQRDAEHFRNLADYFEGMALCRT